MNNEELFRKINKDALYAIIAILFVAGVYSIWPKVGIALTLLIAIIGLGNMYQKGVIK